MKLPYKIWINIKCAHGTGDMTTKRHQNNKHMLIWCLYTESAVNMGPVVDKHAVVLQGRLKGTRVQVQLENYQDISIKSCTSCYSYNFSPILKLIQSLDLDSNGTLQIQKQIGQVDFKLRPSSSMNSSVRPSVCLSVHLSNHFDNVLVTITAWNLQK